MLPEPSPTVATEQPRPDRNFCGPGTCQLPVRVGQETGQEAKLEDTEEGKVKGLVPAKSQNWQKV